MVTLKGIAKAFGAVVVVFLVLGMIKNYSQDGNPLTHDDTDNTVLEVKSAAKGINAEAPVRVSQFARITKAEAEGETLVKHVDLELPLENRKFGIEASSRTKYCSSSKKYRVWRDHGITQKIVLNGSQGDTYTYEVSPSDCKE